MFNKFSVDYSTYAYFIIIKYAFNTKLVELGQEVGLMSPDMCCLNVLETVYASLGFLLVEALSQGCM